MLQLEAKPELQSTPSEAQRLLSKVRTWLLMIPLLYFATDGALLLKNKGSAGEFSTNTDATGGTLGKVEQLLVWGLVCFLMSPALPRLARAAIRQKAISGFIVLAFASIAWSPDPVDALRRSVLIGLTLLFGICLAECYTPREQMLLILLTGVAAVLASFFVVAVAPSYAYGYQGEWKGIFGHKNGLGIYLIFLMSPVFFMRLKRSLLGIAMVCMVSLAAVLVIMSESRTGWLLAFVFGCYVCAYKLIDRFCRRDAKLLSITVMSVAGLLITFAVARYDTLVGLLGKSADFSGRFEIWQAVALAISKHPYLGYGYGGFWGDSHGESMNVELAVGFPLGHAHNGYLNLWLQLGVLGLALFLWSLISAARNGIRSLNLPEHSYAAWCLGILLFVVMGNLDESFIMKYNSLATMVYVMACVGLSKSARGTIRNDLPPA